MKPTRTLIVVADGARARFFTHDRNDTRLTALSDASMEIEVPKVTDIMADRQGRSFSSVGDGRSAMEPRSDPRDLVEKEFAHTVLGRLSEIYPRQKADRIVIAAAPRTLAEMRKKLPKQLEAHVAATLDKDLTNTPESELMKHFGEVLD